MYIYRIYLQSFFFMFCFCLLSLYPAPSDAYCATLFSLTFHKHNLFSLILIHYQSPSPSINCLVSYSCCYLLMFLFPN
uniref:Putative secreted peptide n=1 Tax=Anopheles braziliensis TaxID=58242 RepID=A0A2M3ZQ58_9DIPT